VTSENLETRSARFEILGGHFGVTHFGVTFLENVCVVTFVLLPSGERFGVTRFGVTLV